MRKLSNAIIYNDKKILVVDKIKPNWEVLTILPWWKLDEWESHIEALKREIWEELSIYNINIWKILLTTEWISPTSSINSTIEVFEVMIGNQKINTTAEVINPRFLLGNEILELETTTEITKNIIRQLI